MSAHEQFLVAPSTVVMSIDLPRVRETQPVLIAEGLRPEVLVFEGGGTKGIFYAGAIRRLEEEGFLDGVRCFAGTSAGAQTAAILAFGYTGAEMEAMMYTAPWRDLLDGSGSPCGSGTCCGYGCCKGLYRLHRHHGFYKGDVLQEYLESVFAAKRVNGERGCTLQQLHEEKGVELRVGVCNMTARRFEYLDRHSHPALTVSQAVRASSAIPLVFLPQIINDAIYVDGMFQGNLPIAAFPGKRVLAFHLFNSEDPPNEGERMQRKSVAAFFGDILDMMMNSAQRKHGVNFDTFILDHSTPNTDDLVDILEIDCGNHGVMETRLKATEVREMLNSGREAAENHLNKLRCTTPSRLRRTYSVSSLGEPPRNSLDASFGAWAQEREALGTTGVEQALQTIGRALRTAADASANVEDAQEALHTLRAVLQSGSFAGGAKGVGGGGPTP